jgi:hypothetical protein
VFNPVKIGFGEFMTAFYGSLVPTTRAMHEYCVRGVAKSIQWAPGRMVDKAEEMLDSWRRNDTDSAPTQPAELPVMVVAIADDYTPTGRDFTRQVSESLSVMLPDDTKERVFGLRTIAADLRAQIVIFAADEPTARSIASQFALFLDVPANRRYTATYPFAGFDHEFPVQIESPDAPAINVPVDGVKNVKILALDITLKAEVPLFDAPKDGDPNDGQGTPGTDDPAGYPVVTELAITPYEATP